MDISYGILSALSRLSARMSFHIERVAEFNSQTLPMLPHSAGTIMQKLLYKYWSFKTLAKSYNTNSKYKNRKEICFWYTFSNWNMFYLLNIFFNYWNKFIILFLDFIQLKQVYSHIFHCVIIEKHFCYYAAVCIMWYFPTPEGKNIMQAYSVNIRHITFIFTFLYNDVLETKNSIFITNGLPI